MRYYRSNDPYQPTFSGGFGFFPPVLKGLLIVNVGIFLLQQILDSYTIKGVPLEDYITYYFGLLPIGQGFKIWQLFTYMFLHANFSHVLFNMFGLWMFGIELEHVMGSKKFLIYYLTCGVGGGLLHLLMGPVFSHPAITVGASGAIYGILLAFGLIFPDRLIFLYFFIPIKAKYFVLLFIFFEILAVGNQDIVAHLAHLGGALTGYIFLMVETKKFPFEWLFEKKTYSKSKSKEVEFGEIENAEVYDIRTGKKVNKDEKIINQEIIDSILDKISKYGYQGLTEEEKRILFEASKKLD